MVSAPRPRVNAAQRRLALIEIGMSEFSRRGFHGASTTRIAEQVGMSQPNVFRLFPTKKDLFLAVLTHLENRIEQEMIAPGREAAGSPRPAMQAAWQRLASDRNVMLMLLQGFAASDDPEIRQVMRRMTMTVFDQVEVGSGGDAHEAHTFMAEGMLFMVAAAMDLYAQAPTDPWAAKFLTSG